MTRDEALPLRKIQLGNWLLLGLMTGGAAVFFGGAIARAVVVGGLVANISFWLLKRDLIGVLTGDQTGVKARFFIKYYARLALLALVLFLLVKYVSLNIPALLAGLSVVFLSIAGVAVVAAIKTFKFREAS
ncbi:MAG: hypothetical protein HGA96_06785 [Desulfobulbaceae bacterium]|nr:hypothetical protein [Desulfobulbaceae bacterium]